MTKRATLAPGLEHNVKMDAAQHSADAQFYTLSSKIRHKPTPSTD